MLSHVSKDCTQCAHAQGFVTRYGDVVLAALLRGQAKVAAGLACYLVAVAPEQDGKLLASPTPSDRRSCEPA